MLVVDDDAELRSAVTRELSEHGFDVSTADDVAAALVQIRAAHPDVLLTDLRMSEADGIDLLHQARESSPKTRAILMSAYATARDHQVALELGAVRVLCKPFTSTELLQAIRQAVDCETGFRGSVHGLSLVDLLQMFHYGRRSIRIDIGAPIQGSIHIQQGEVVHATHGDEAGEEALRALLATPSGAITTTAAEDAPRTIERSFRSLLLDLLRQLDEADGGSEADLDLAFDAEWDTHVSVRSDRLDRVSRELQRLGPEAAVVQVDPNGRCTPLSSSALVEPELAACALEIGSALTRLTGGWTQVEVLRGDVAIALIRGREGECVVLVTDVLIGRYAIVKFRAQTGRVAALL